MHVARYNGLADTMMLWEEWVKAQSNQCLFPPCVQRLVQATYRRLEDAGADIRIVLWSRIIAGSAFETNNASRLTSQQRSHDDYGQQPVQCPELFWFQKLFSSENAARPKETAARPWTESCLLNCFFFRDPAVVENVLMQPCGSSRTFC